MNLINVATSNVIRGTEIVRHEACKGTIATDTATSAHHEYDLVKTLTSRDLLLFFWGKI